MVLVGVDGCPAGWLAAVETRDVISVEVFATFGELVRTYKTASRILVDMPIGLPTSTCPGRICDKLARKVLGRRASSVFSPPCGKAAAATSLSEARQINILEVGKSISAQAWGICRKIAEVDRSLRSDPVAAAKVFEVHPEICFWALNGKRPMNQAKKNLQGRQERLTLLTTWEPRTEELFQQAMRLYKRRDVQADDILDALVALVTGRAVDGALGSLPEDPPVDSNGLQMRMVYRLP